MTPIEVAERVLRVALELVGPERVVELVAKAVGAPASADAMIAAMYAANDAAADALQRAKLGDRR